MVILTKVNSKSANCIKSIQGESCFTNWIQEILDSRFHWATYSTLLEVCGPAYSFKGKYPFSKVIPHTSPLLNEMFPFSNVTLTISCDAGFNCYLICRALGRFPVCWSHGYQQFPQREDWNGFIFIFYLSMFFCLKFSQYKVRTMALTSTVHSFHRQNWIQCNHR